MADALRRYVVEHVAWRPLLHQAGGVNGLCVSRLCLCESDAEVARSVCGVLAMMEKIPLFQRRLSGQISKRGRVEKGHGGTRRSDNYVLCKGGKVAGTK